MYTYKLCKPFPPSNEVTMVRLNETNTFIPFDLTKCFRIKNKEKAHITKFTKQL
jgi:hypothetical protein